jgi:N,N'-diacetyllegionaminate synthase
VVPSSFSFQPGEVYVIAEAGVNHNGDLVLAKKLIEVASEARADAVKFQMFEPDEIATDQAPLATYQQRSGEKSQRAMLERLVLPRESFRTLKTYAEERGIAFITTPFDGDSADYLASIGVRVMKVPSGEITNIPYLKRVARLGLFTIISTGMATLEEVHAAVAPFVACSVPFALLHCVSSYPAPAEQINLRAMETLRREFSVPVGYSDHTEGIAVPVMAAALGAQIIEKHFTLDRTMVGPDHAASLEPEELAEMILRIRDGDALKHTHIDATVLGNGEKRCQPCEENVRAIGRRSVILQCDATAGTVLTHDMLAIKRPGTGIAPGDLERTIGRTLSRPLTAGSVLTGNDIQ